MKFIGPGQRRPALSETIGALLSVAITLVAGATVFGYVKTQAGVSENMLATSFGATGSFLSERFVVVDINYSSSAPSTSLSIWFYNSGKVNLYPVRVEIYNASVTGGNKIDIIYDASTVSTTRVKNIGASQVTTTCSTAATSSNEKPTLYNAKLSASQQASGVVNIAQGAISKLTLYMQTPCSSVNISYQTGMTYYVNVLGLFGNTVIYFQTK